MLLLHNKDSSSPNSHTNSISFQVSLKLAKFVCAKICTFTLYREREREREDNAPGTKRVRALLVDSESGFKV